MMPNPPTTTSTSPASPAPVAPPDAVAVFRALFETAYDIMDLFLYRLRSRAIAQTCRAFALAASCLWRLVRIELTLRLAPARITPGELARIYRLRHGLHYFSGKPGELLAAFMKTHTASPAASARSAAPDPVATAQPPLPAAPHSPAPQPLAEILPTEAPAVTAPFGFSDLPPVQDAPPVQDVPPVHEVNEVNGVNDVHLDAPGHPLPDDPSADPFAPDPLRPASPLLANLAAALRDCNFTRPLYDLARLHPSAASALLAHPGATLISVIRDLDRLDRFYVQDALARAAQSPSPSEFELSPSPSPSQSQSELFPHSSGLPESEDAYVIFQLPNPHCPEQSPSPSNPSEKAQWAFETAIPNPQSTAPP